MYKGKFHLVKPGSPTGEWTQEDLAAYGYSRWTPPDCGANQVGRPGSRAEAWGWAKEVGEGRMDGLMGGFHRVGRASVGQGVRGGGRACGSAADTPATLNAPSPHTLPCTVPLPPPLVCAPPRT